MATIITANQRIYADRYWNYQGISGDEYPDFTEDSGYQVYIDVIVESDTETFLSTVKYKLYLVTPEDITLDADTSVNPSGNPLSYVWLSGILDTRDYFDFPAGTYKTGTHLIREGQFTGQSLHNEVGIPYSGLSHTSIYPNVEFIHPTYNKCTIDSSGRSSFDLNISKIPRISSIICSTAYLGDPATITVTKKVSSYTHKIDYQFGGLSGSVVGKTSNTTIKWTLPFDFLSQFGTTEIQKKGKLTCTTYNSSGTIEGTSTCEFVALIDGDVAAPTLAPVLEDTDSVTLALTGDSSKIVKYYSDVLVKPNAEAQAGATITSLITTWGNQKFSGDEGTIYNVDTDHFIIDVTDTRGLSRHHYQTVENFVDYSKLTCNFFPEFIAPDGTLDFVIEGNYFGKSFGAASNRLTVQYRYKVKDDDAYSDWITARGTASTIGYAYNLTIRGLDYKTLYVFQARAIDALMTIESAEKYVTGFPVYDWGKDNFNFNVSITAKEPMTFATNKAIAGFDVDGSEKSALIPCDGIGNTVLGFGNYQNESGDTLIYGKNIHLTSSDDITLNGASINDLSLASAGVWYPVSNAANAPLYSYGNYLKLGNVCIINFYYQAVADITPTNNLYFTGLPFTPDTNYRWQAGGGNCSGYRVQGDEQVFCGWSIESEKIYGRTIYSGSAAGATSVSGYIGVTSGTTFYASGTIMYKIAEQGGN